MVLRRIAAQKKAFCLATEDGFFQGKNPVIIRNISKNDRARSVVRDAISVARRGGFQVCPSFIGHGIGSYFHGHPEVWHHTNDIGLLMEEGMAFTIEPIIMEGSPEFITLKDKWTAISVDNKRSAQFEHTIVITSEGAEILSKLVEEA